MIIIVMGVSGVGKSTVGRSLADSLGFQFADADDFHSPENRLKMAGGHSLSDEDRQPWLAALAARISQWQLADESAVLACSALKETYRATLLASAEDYLIVYLKAEFDKIHARLEARQNHFMKASMLKSQFAALEEPHAAPRNLIIDADLPLATIVSQVEKVVATIV